jgi:methionyl-tRNA formyltransferase
MEDKMSTDNTLTINYGEISTYILFGGGYLLTDVAKTLKKQGFSVYVVTSERHSEEMITINSEEISFVQFLEQEGFKYVISSNLTTDTKVLELIANDSIGLSFGAAWIFRKDFIDRFSGKLLNLHGARLPQNRGGGGFSWRILRGERIGVSLIHKIDPGVDTGDIIISDEYIYPTNCRTPSDYQEFSIKKYKEFLDLFFSMVAKKETFKITMQQESFSSYWPRLATDIHGFIDWNWELPDIEKFICAFDDPYSGASTFINDTAVRIKDCYSWTDDGVYHPFQQGIIYRKSKASLFVAIKQGTLIINTILDESGNDIKKALRVGDRFYTPRNILEDALRYRAIYTPKGLKEG